MFERLGEIVENNERFHSDDDCPEVFMWFPMDKNYIGPASLNENNEEKTERLIKLTKYTRTQLHRITSGLDATGEERLLEYLELKDSIIELNALLAACEGDSSENSEKAKNGVNEVNKTISGLSFDALVTEIFIDNQFKVGVQKVLTPWIDCLEKEAFKISDKPKSFEEAREHEREAVIFAKEVRKANKLLSKMEGEANNQTNKLFSSQLIEDQKTRFRHIAQSAANKVEKTRNVIQNWGFFLELKGEADQLLESSRSVFPALERIQNKELDENDYANGLPLILDSYISGMEMICQDPDKPSTMESCVKQKSDWQTLQNDLKKASNILKKISGCTEKTPAHQEVWKQTTRLKKVIGCVDKLIENLVILLTSWSLVAVSEKEDNLDFQPIIAFLQTYESSFALCN